MKSESPVKKHHFWILCGVVPLFTLIGVLMVSAKVGGKISDRLGEIKKSQDELNGKDAPKTDGLLAELDKVGKVVTNKQVDLHKDNWDRQKGLYVWPGRSALFANVWTGYAAVADGDPAALEAVAERLVEMNAEGKTRAEREASAQKLRAAWGDPPLKRADWVREQIGKMGGAEAVAKVADPGELAKVADPTNNAPEIVQLRRLLSALEPARPRFGADLPELTKLFDEFRTKPETYQGEFTNEAKTGLVDRLAPTQFPGGPDGWKAVVRHVNDFGDVLFTKEQVWLMLEDLWVQRSVLGALREVNDDLGRFTRTNVERVRTVGGKTVRTPVDKNDPGGRIDELRWTFKSRVWKIELGVAPVNPGDTSGRLRLSGTLTNMSDRLQLFGLNNTLTLNVWLSADKDAKPKEFRFGGSLLPGDGSKRQKPGTDQQEDANVLVIEPLQSHTLTDLELPNRAALDVVRVEQVFDTRTVPVKRINALVIGHPMAVDARNARTEPLVPPLGKGSGGLFADAFVKDATPAAASGDTGGATGMGRGGPGTAPPGTGSSEGPGGLGGAGGTGRAAGGGKMLEVVGGLDTANRRVAGNINRYLAATPQVRRMPVALSVVVDQEHVQDVLLALSNSPLRFQITQMSWARFRGTLDGIGGSTGGAGGSDEGFGGLPPPTFGGGLGGPADPDGPRGPGSLGLPPGGPRGPGSLGGPGGSIPGGSIPGGSIPGGPGGSFPGGPGASVSESQLTAGLVELTVYGVVSLYEKFEATPAAGAAPAGTPNAPPAPAPNTPPPAPAPNAPAPKQRRRRA